MNRQYSSNASILINSTKENVWKVLTNAESVKKFMFGAEVKTDWQVGSSISYVGEWQGNKYEDKGTILQAVPNKLLKMSYWSPFSGIEDKEENYQNVSYILEEKDGKTLLTITQDNIPQEENAKHYSDNWTKVLEEIKKILER